MMDRDSIYRAIEAHGQAHLLQFYDELDPAEGASLLKQIAAIDLEGLDRLIDGYVVHKTADALEGKIEPPEVLAANPSDEVVAADYERARKRG